MPIALVNRYTRNKFFEIVEILLELIKAFLKSGEDLMISEFGRFSVKEKAKRRGRNQLTVEILVLSPRKVVTFKWFGKLKEKLNTKPKTKKISVKSIKKY